jgi:hypothetical protein
MAVAQPHKTNRPSGFGLQAGHAAGQQVAKLEQPRQVQPISVNTASVATTAGFRLKA